MPKKLKVGDPVFNGEDFEVPYFIVNLDEKKRTASIKTTHVAVVIHHNVAFADLTILDESQNAARIVREATEDK
jgi:hypothetical protein